MTELRHPISESYWVAPGRLLAGEYPGQYDEDLTRRRLNALIEAGFDTFIDLTRPHETIPYAGILQEEARVYNVSATHRRFPIADFGLPTPELMNDILAAIEAILKAGHKIYLHCWGGIGRTGTTVGCYLVRQGKTGDEALDQLSKWWQGVPKSAFHPRSPETLAQANFVRTWAVHDDQLSKARS
jgi:hypothetical protein